MRRLVQKVVDINPSISSSPDRLQSYFDKKSSEGWEYCGQVGLFHLFKRWEEVPNVVDGGGYGGYSQYNPHPYQSYSPYRPSTSYPPYTPQYRPQQFGVKVNEDEDNKYSSNPFDE